MQRATHTLLLLSMNEPRSRTAADASLSWFRTSKPVVDTLLKQMTKTPDPIDDEPVLRIPLDQNSNALDAIHSFCIENENEIDV